MIIRVLYKQAMFIRRGYLVDASYKTDMALKVLATAFPLFTVYFIAELMDGGRSRFLERYGGGYFAYAFLGVATTQFLQTALDTFAANIRRSQISGVFEATIHSKTPPQGVLLYDATYPFLVGSLHLSLSLFIATTVLHLDLSAANAVSTAVVATLAMATFVGLGFVSAAAIVVLKQGDPVRLFAGVGVALLTGAYFPRELDDTRARGRSTRSTPRPVTT
jgi:ABC-2 type transport system permease protein